MDRTQLVEAAQSGSSDALAALVDEFAPTVLGAAYGWCGDRELAADIAQEAFAVVIARIGDVTRRALPPSSTRDPTWSTCASTGRATTALRTGCRGRAGEARRCCEPSSAVTMRW